MLTGYVITCEDELAREETDAQATDRAKRMAASHDMVAYIYVSKDTGELVPAGHVPPMHGSQEMPRYPEGSGIERGKPRPEKPTVEDHLRTLERYVADAAAASAFSEYGIVDALMRRQYRK